MNRNFIFFINPISGTGNKELLQQQINNCFKNKPHVYKILDTNADANYNFLPAQIVNEKITDIVICGGDGTVNQICAYLLGIKVQVGIIPMGSGNGMALSAGIPTNIKAALNWLFTATAQLTDAVYINEHFSCMLCGLGFDAAVAHEFAKQKKRGLLSYTKLTIRQFAKAKPYNFQLNLKDKEIKAKAFFISIANSNQFGNHITIAPQARLNDGLLDVVLVNKMSKLQLVFSMLKQLLFGKVKEPVQRNYFPKEIEYFQTDSLVILNPQLAPMHIDGEPMPSFPRYEIKIIKDAFWLLRA